MPQKSYNISHCTFSPALGRSYGRREKNYKTTSRRDGTEFVAAPQRPVVAWAYGVSFWDMSAIRQPHHVRLRAKDIAPHSAALLSVQPISLRVSGGVSWLANQQHGGGCRRERTKERLFLETLPKEIFPSSVSTSCSAPAASSPATGLRRASASRAANARSATPILSSRAGASRTRGQPQLFTWRCSKTETPERKITASPRRSIAGVGTDGAASASASQPSYLLAPGDPASDKGACGDVRMHAPPATIPAAGYAALGRGPRNHGSLITGSGAGLALSCGGRAVAARLAHNQEVEGSSPFPATTLRFYASREAHHR